MDVNNLREISVQFKSEENCTKYLVMKNDVDNMVEAIVRLHIEPGLNPYNRIKTSSIEMITLGKPKINNYWWSSADLIGKDKTKIANVIDFDENEIIFASKNEVIDNLIDCFLETTFEYETSSGSPYPEKKKNAEIEKIKKNALAYSHPRYAHLFIKTKVSTKFS
ncbi:hypothetical protein QJ856_gp0738 [Tupanvirus deep ocean]|uniref:Uncharacterized protein n=2 Tax=Tupanvirus TaxID=2094720 RepID=A0AC62A8E1_9VIRU|nr:hypothetical protein QJ856_gp0738 [Tupanvirus deep ocean]QKU34014.1 hypothetical protein [Tupanvirus deep ocean]